MYQAERGLFELKQGRPLRVRAGVPGTSDVLLATVEGLTEHIQSRLRFLGTSDPRLVVTQHRATVMGLTNGGPPRAASLRLPSAATPEDIFHLASSPAPGSTGQPDWRSASASEIGGLTLARLGRLLPAVVAVAIDPARTLPLREELESHSILSVTTEQIEAMAANAHVELTHVSDGPVPLALAEDTRFMFFREGNGLVEHVAILIGNRDEWPDPVPVRVHSACLTGDLFGSLRCDCGEQLQGSLRVFASEGGGILLYLAQEGRNIGLANKLRAYALQQGGLDTVDADRVLGFGADERQYDAAVEMLHYLGIDQVRLLTNNPDKVRALRNGGIQVTDRQALYGTLNRHNLMYVRAKINRAGHWLGEMLASAMPDR